MPIYRPEDYAIGIIGMALGCAIAVVLIRRKLYIVWPGFFAYTAFHIFQPIADMVGVLQQWPQLTYFYFFYFLELISVTLSLFVIYEIFFSVLKPYDALKRFASRIFFVVAALLLIVAAGFIIFGSGTEGVRLFKLVYYSERSLRIVQVGLLLFLFALSRSFALSWRSNLFGIALGYGVYACIQLVLVALRLKFVTVAEHPISTISSFSFVLMYLIWLSFMLQPETVAEPVRTIPHNDIEKWNEKLEELLKRKSA